MHPPAPKISRLQEWALRLNRRQTRALLLGVVISVLFAVNPYWYVIRDNGVGGRTRVPAGFHFVASPPTSDDLFHIEAHIDWIVFAIIEAVCIGLTIGFVSGLRDKNNEARATYGQYR